MEIIDISYPVRNGIQVWPGDSPFQFEQISCIGVNSPANVGTIHMSTHTGTHIDAPWHFLEDGERVGSLELINFIGPALVIFISDRQEIREEDLKCSDLSSVKILLIRTDSWSGIEGVNSLYSFLSPDIARFFKENNISLVGIDTPSVDSFEDNMLTAHHNLHSAGISILEGLSLKNVDPGYYFLIAMPLSLSDADASPVRAVLLKSDNLIND